MQNILLFIVLTCFWGCSFIAIREALIGVPPFMAASLRVFIGGLLLGTLALIKKSKVSQDNDPRMPVKLMGLGLVSLGIPWACLFWGEQYVAPAVASIINSSVPLFVAIFSWSILKTETPKPKDLFAVVLGFVGILLVFVPALKDVSLGEKALLGMGVILVMAVSYGLGTSLVKKLGKGVDANWSMFYQAVGACALLFLLSFTFEEQTWVQTISTHPKSILAIFYLAIFSTATAWVIYFYLIHHWGAVQASAVTYTMPLVAIAVDVFVLGVWPKSFQLMGAGIILVALLIMRTNPKKVFEAAKNKLAA